MNCGSKTAHASAPAHEATEVIGLGQGTLTTGRGDLERVALANVRARMRDALAELERLGEVAGRDVHVVTFRGQALNQGAHHEHVRAVGEIDPDAHPHSRGAKRPSPA